MQNVYVEDALGNSLKLHDLTDPQPQFFIMTPISGLEYPVVRTGQFNNAGTDGISITSQYTGERRVAVVGKVVNPSSYAQLVTLRRQFLAAMAPKRDVNGVLIQKWLRFTAMDGVQYRLLGQVLDSTLPIDNIMNAGFQLDFLASYPVIEAFAQSSQVMQTITFGGFVLPVILPIVFGAGTGGTYTVTDNGDQPAYPLITFNGPLTNPRLTNLTLAFTMALSLTIPSGQSVVVDMFNRTITQGGVTNRMSAKTADSSFWALQSGANRLNLTTSNTGDTGSATVAWRDAYMGV